MDEVLKMGDNDLKNEEVEFLLTTKDNPYNPFTQWDEWYTYDETNGYCSCGYVSRIADTSPDMSDEWNDEETRRAIDEIIRIDPFGIYTRIYRDGHKDSDVNEEATLDNKRS